ncbi:hypothetical protein [Actinomadura rudentiformis]|uniref:Uncharacterized protein n=1 Tax=Actinomadura rudentiformis TaxID=359158 RepID=A0A6H9Z205_9ACTN|nr:hypothetical protein [Actinomadura rudentiformis]KAB2347297.1 hypothetical protein F8566_19995 [Actinomadura rudentiformis]
MTGPHPIPTQAPQQAVSQTAPHPAALDIPAWAHALRIAAITEAQEADTCLRKERDACGDLAHYQQWANQERARLEEHLRAVHAQTMAKLDEISAEEQQLEKVHDATKNDKRRHLKSAEGAEHAWLDFCTREGVDPKAVPPVHIDNDAASGNGHTPTSSAPAGPPGAITDACIDYVNQTFYDGAATHDLAKVFVTCDDAEYAWTGRTAPGETGDQVPLMGAIAGHGNHIPFDHLTRHYGLTATSRDRTAAPAFDGGVTRGDIHLSDIRPAQDVNGTGPQQAAGAAPFPTTGERGE